MDLHGVYSRSNDLTRAVLARLGPNHPLSCTCNETTTKSGQAWRGFDCAPGVMAGFPLGTKKPPEGGSLDHWLYVELQ